MLRKLAGPSHVRCRKETQNEPTKLCSYIFSNFVLKVFVVVPTRRNREPESVKGTKKRTILT